MKKNRVFVSMIVIFVGSISCSGEDYDSDIPALMEDGTTAVSDTAETNQNEIETKTMNITIGNKMLTATMVDNSSVDALTDALSKGQIKIEMRDYGNMEKVGSLGMELPRNDKSITTQAGDLILYQGNAFVIYYAPNSWNFTRLGKIDNINGEELKEILGEGDVTVTLSLPRN